MRHSRPTLWRGTLPRFSALIAMAAVLAIPSLSWAIPAFARRTGMSCSACHDAWPRLNDFGEAYRDNGYQLPGRQDADPASSGYFPISERPALLYQYVRTTNQPSDAGPVTVGSGQIQFPSMDLLAGGPLADNIAALIVASGFGQDGTAPIESAWLRLSNLGGTPWLNVRAGKIELDLPVSEHRALLLTQPFQIYHYQPQGSINTFGIGDNQVGIEVMGHSAPGVGLRYAVSLTSAQSASGSPLSGTFWSAPAVYAHVTETIHPFNTGFTRLRLGLLGTGGVFPTTSQTLSAGGSPSPVPGTGADHRAFYQAGGEVALTFGSLARPFMVHVVGLYGGQDVALSQLAPATPCVPGMTPTAVCTRDTSYYGGFAEVSYVPILRLAVFGRYDMVRAVNSPYGPQPATAPVQNPLANNAGDLDGFAVGGRWALLQTFSAAVMLHLEASWLVTQGAGVNGTNSQQTILAAGFDVAL